MIQEQTGNPFRKRKIKRVGTPIRANLPIKVNKDIALDLLQLVPFYWKDPEIAQSTGYIVNLEPSSDKFFDIVHLMNSNIGSHMDNYGVVADVKKDPKYFEVVKIEMIQCPDMWKTYAHMNSFYSFCNSFQDHRPPLPSILNSY